MRTVTTAALPLLLLACRSGQGVDPPAQPEGEVPHGAVQLLVERFDRAGTRDWYTMEPNGARVEPFRAVPPEVLRLVPSPDGRSFAEIVERPSGGGSTSGAPAATAGSGARSSRGIGSSSRWPGRPTAPGWRSACRTRTTRTISGWWRRRDRPRSTSRRTRRASPVSTGSQLVARRRAHRLLLQPRRHRPPTSGRWRPTGPAWRRRPAGSLGSERLPPGRPTGVHRLPRRHPRQRRGGGGRPATGSSPAPRRPAGPPGRRTGASSTHRPAGTSSSTRSTLPRRPGEPDPHRPTTTGGGSGASSPGRGRGWRRSSAWGGGRRRGLAAGDLEGDGAVDLTLADGAGRCGSWRARAAASGPSAPSTPRPTSACSWPPPSTSPGADLALLGAGALQVWSGGQVVLASRPARAPRRRAGLAAADFTWSGASQLAAAVEAPDGAMRLVLATSTSGASARCGTRRPTHRWPGQACAADVTGDGSVRSSW